MSSNNNQPPVAQVITPEMEQRGDQLVKDTLRKIDTNHDHKLTLDEFRSHLYTEGNPEFDLDNKPICDVIESSIAKGYFTEAQLDKDYLRQQEERGYESELAPSKTCPIVKKWDAEKQR